MAKRKCPICQQRSETDEMVEIQIGKLNKWIHKIECYDQHLEREKEKQIEVEKWNELYEYIRELHGLITPSGKLPLPPAIVVRLQRLRNGEDFRGGGVVKTFKMGAPYDLILDAYKIADKNIQWCMANKLDGTNDVKAMNYCMSIAIDCLNDAWLQRKTNENKQKRVEEIMKQDIPSYVDYDLDYESNYASRKR